MTATAKSNPISSPPSHCPRSPTKINLIDYGLVDPSVPALNFDAAASYALPQAYRDGCNHASSQILEELLLVSPYTAKAHLLDLSTLGKTDQLLAKALTVMKPSRNDYATSPYTDTFNWQTIIDTLRSLAKQEGYAWEAEAFYIVVFRSQVPPMTDRSHLGEMDRKSHEEAMKSGGLLKYWFGVPDESGRNLATCVWRDQEDAKRGGAGDNHRQAMRATFGLYTEWELERLRFVIDEGIERWRIEPWDK